MKPILFVSLILSCFAINAQDIVFEKTWIKAVPSSLKMSAMFGILKNKTDKDIKLISVSGDLAKNIEIQKSVSHFPGAANGSNTGIERDIHLDS